VKRIVLGDCLDVLAELDDGCARLIYLDPPFNTGKVQRRRRIRAVRDEQGDRTGFTGRRYKTEVLGTSAWNDAFDDYLGFLARRTTARSCSMSSSGAPRS
jgi:site-specific DNA-methyltransferase (adenine-specific)